MSDSDAQLDKASDNVLVGHDGQQRRAQGQRHDRMPGSGNGGGHDRHDEINITVAQRMVSATTGSLITSLLVTPLDVVRVRLQAQTSSPSTPPPALNPSPKLSSSFARLPPNLGVTACCREVFWMNNNSLCIATPTTPSSISIPTVASSCVAEETQKKTFNSTADALRKIARNEGLPVLWRGLSPTLAMAVPANVIYFTGYDWFRYNPSSPLRMKNSEGEFYVTQAGMPLIAGSVARIIAATVISPIEMFRTRLQAESTNTRASTQAVYSKTAFGLKDLVVQQGVKSLWRGWTLTVWRDVPFSGFYWWGYETMFHTLQRWQKSSTHMSTFASSFTSGFVSGATASILTMPFDVGKTRQQVFMHASGIGSGAAASKASAANPIELGMIRFLHQIYKNEGLAGLWKGWLARTLKVAPACAIMISSYELGKVFAKGSNEKTREDL